MALIEIESLGKRYKHYARPGDRLREWATAGLVRRHADNWVLRGVEMQVAAGEAVAIIGANGAGKSTLLKIVAGTTLPSEGRVRVRGRVVSLELGLGFHPDLTGRENAYAAGELFGLRRSEIEAHMPEIEDFASIGSAVEDPVRTYSSGMAMRLAFSVATVVRPEILIIDEVLAVGDAYFQHKCVRRIREFRDQGTTLLFASHDPTAVRSLCDRAFLLDTGLLARQGETTAVLDYYNAMIARMQDEDAILQGEQLEGASDQTRSGSRDAVVEDVDLLCDGHSARAFPVGAEITIRIHGRALREVTDLTAGFAIRDRLGNEVFGTNTRLLEVPRAVFPEGAAFTAEFRAPVNLGVGNYSLTVALHAGAVHLEGSYDWWDNALVLQVIPSGAPFSGCAYLPTRATLVPVRATPGASR